MIRKIFPIALIILCNLIPEHAAAKDGYRRNQDIDILHYCFRINLNDSTDQIEGSARITISLANPCKFAELDLTSIKSSGKGMVVSRVETDSSPLPFQHENDRLRIDLPEKQQVPGQLTITINYSGIPADGLIISRNKFGERTFFGDNWPDRARNWLPCVDHPSDKATVEFIVTAPEKYKIVSNGWLQSEYPVTGTHNTRERVTHWIEDVPVPTKVMVIGAADFAWETAGFSKGIPVQTWVYSQDRVPGFIDYKPAADIVTFYQDLIGPYSYEKLANVQSRTIFGGMENSGCIFYYEKSVTGKNKLQGLLAHEIAHQWFGDAVTENDWHHIWLSEGFATYLEACYADSLIAGRKLDASMADMRKEVVAYFERNRKPLIDTTITNNMNLLSTNSYQKGAWFLHMLRQEVGDSIFWTGVRKFYHDFRNGNAMTSDFQSVMEEVSGQSLTGFFHQWLEIPGQPVIKWSWSYNPTEKQVQIDVEQMQEQYCFTFKLPLELRGDSTDQGTSIPYQTVYYQVPITQRKVRIILPVDFPVSEIRLDPKTQLLFQEKKASK